MPRHCLLIILVVFGFCLAAACAGTGPGTVPGIERNATPAIMQPVAQGTGENKNLIDNPVIIQESGGNALILMDHTNINSIRKMQQEGTVSGFEPEIRNITRSADRFLSQKPLSVTEKTILLPNASPHDYISLSTYYWPDPKKAGGLPYILRDGETNPERDDGMRYDSRRKSVMTDAIRTLALAYVLTNNETYAVKAGDYLRTWFLDPETCMNPSLEYAQIIPGTGSAGRGTGIIDTVDFIPLTDAVQILEGSRALTPDETERIRNWFRNYTAWLVTSPNGMSESKATNNHGTWYDAQVAAYCLYTGDTMAARAIVNASRERRIAAQVQPNGSMPRELARTKSLHYTLFNLEAFITLAREGELTGVDLWRYRTPDGRSLQAAIDFVLPSVTGQAEWKYKEIQPGPDPGFAPYLMMAGQAYCNQTYKEEANGLIIGRNDENAFLVRILNLSHSLSNVTPKVQT